MVTEEEELAVAYWVEGFLHELNIHLWKKYGPVLDRLPIPPAKTVDAALVHQADRRIGVAQNLHDVSVALRAAYGLDSEPW